MQNESYANDDDHTNPAAIAAEVDFDKRFFILDLENAEKSAMIVCQSDIYRFSVQSLPPLFLAQLSQGTSVWW